MVTIVETIDDIKKLLKKNKVKLFGLGGYPSTRSEIWPFVPNYEVICGNTTGELKAVKQRVRVKVFSQAKVDKTAEKKPQVILNNSKVIDYIKNRAKKNKVALYIYQPKEETERICQKNGWTMLANKPELFDQYSNKLEFYKILKELNISRDIEIISLNKLEKKLDELFDRWGDKIVVQLLDEGGGRGTFFFRREEKDEIIEKIEKRINLIKKEKINNIQVAASKFIKGPVLSITSCITRDNGILTSYCQYQLIDIAEVTRNKKDATGIFCGHDWSLSSELPDEINKKGQELAIKIGEKLKEKGLLGLFGLDLIWGEKENDLMPLEINPRLLGSFPAVCYVNLDKKEVPLVGFHLLEFLGISYKIKNENVYRNGKERRGAHLLLFNSLGHNAKCQKELKGGIYKLDKGRIKWVRLGVELIDIKEAGEFIITEGVPIKSLVYKKNGKLLKIIAKEKLSLNHGKELNGWAKQIVAALYKELNLISYEN